MKRVALTLAVPFVLLLLLVNPYVRGDGNGYYAWLTSPLLDGDVHFGNQYLRADPTQKMNSGGVKWNQAGAKPANWGGCWSSNCKMAFRLKK